MIIVWAGRWNIATATVPLWARSKGKRSSNYARWSERTRWHASESLGEGLVLVQTYLLYNMAADSLSSERHDQGRSAEEMRCSWPYIGGCVGSEGSSLSFLMWCLHTHHLHFGPKPLGWRVLSFLGLHGRWESKTKKKVQGCAAKPAAEPSRICLSHLLVCLCPQPHRHTSLNESQLIRQLKHFFFCP
ncbi:uncharacterized protein LY79DRAFT_386275 [Colletotrichum navitas]|uniref:Uncharacterized protein n=1 Tax=Colletotrichum navitas TaxID=681940 RepID=A0AAD8Q7M1_9PEZI|nr:uncharacterized protein LY79DRAFT_386275 [Colletotrichum navitas]KAK1597458.1 hypothetical protein LY79DRAFT_386275 [Colletotrichum navitas]